MILLGVLMFLFLNVGFADEASDRINELRRQIEELEKQADAYKNSIGQKQQEAESFKREIAILNDKIAKLKLQIRITQSQISKTRLEIEDFRQQIVAASEDMDKRKQTIAKIIRSLNKADNQTTLAIILRNGKLSDILGEIQHLNNLQKNLIAQVEELQDLKDKLEGFKEQRESRAAELENLNKKQVQESNSLNNTQDYKEDLLKKTKGEEKKYQQLLTEVEKKKSQFFKELQDLEIAARQRGVYIVKVSGPVPPKGKIFSYPFDDYYLTQSYGRTKYSRRGAYGGAPHNGIDLASAYGAPIKSMGDGVVVAAGFNDGFGNWAAVKHDPPAGGLVSLYAHMRSPSHIPVNTRVARGEAIGYEGSTGNSTGPHLHLSLYHDFFTYINDKNGQLYFNYFEGTLNPLNYM